MPWGNPGSYWQAACSGVAVAANQAWGKYAVPEVIRRGAADVIMTDLHQEGGLAARSGSGGMALGSNP